MLLMTTPSSYYAIVFVLFLVFVAITQKRNFHPRKMHRHFARAVMFGRNGDTATAIAFSQLFRHRRLSTIRSLKSVIHNTPHIQQRRERPRYQFQNYLLFAPTNQINTLHSEYKHAITTASQSPITLLHAQRNNAADWPHFSSPIAEPTQSIHQILNSTSPDGQKKFSGDGVCWTYPANMEDFKKTLLSLDEKFLQLSSHSNPLDCLENNKWETDHISGLYKINAAIINVFKEDLEKLDFDETAEKRYRAKNFEKVLDILQYTTIPITSSAVALVILREGGIKLKGEERYFVRYGKHKSSVLRRIRTAIEPFR